MKNEIVKVNFGSFASSAPGWINLDVAWKHIFIAKIPGLARALYSLGLLKKYVYVHHSRGEFRNVIYGDASKKMKFGTKSIDYIYSSHMLEHLYPKDAFFFLTECHRVLKRGGRLRLLLPDLEVVAKKYLDELKNGNNAASKNFCDAVYATSFKEGYKNSHKWMYDKYSLTAILKKIGFDEVVTGKYRSGNFPNVNKLDSQEESLIIEAKK